MFLSQLNNGAWGFGFKHLKGLQGVCRGSATSMHGMFPRPDSSHVPIVLLLSLLLCWWRFLSTCGFSRNGDTPCHVSLFHRLLLALIFVFLQSVLTLDRAVKIAQPIYNGMTHPPSSTRTSACGICGDSRVSLMVFPWKGLVALTSCLNELKMCQWLLVGYESNQVGRVNSSCQAVIQLFYAQEKQKQDAGVRWSSEFVLPRMSLNSTSHCEIFISSHPQKSPPRPGWTGPSEHSQILFCTKDVTPFLPILYRI